MRDQAPPVEVAVAHGGEFVEVEKPRLRGLQRRLGLTQLLVLHLELDLVDLQLVQQSLQGFGRLWRLAGLGSLVPECRFGTLAQRRVGLGGRRRAFGAHGRSARSAWPVAPGEAAKRSVVATA